LDRRREVEVAGDDGKGPRPRSPCSNGPSCVSHFADSRSFTTFSSYPTSPEPSLAERWNGTSWSIEATPNPAGSVVSALQGVACLNDTECRAVGYWTKGPMAKTLTEFRA
jgi:hypothetical protein